MSTNTPDARITPVILCGGSGTRLWPRSRVDKPKPFLPLVGEQSLFQETLARCGDDTLFTAPLIVCGAHHQSLVEAQLGQADHARMLIEPGARNTAPAIALAAHAVPGDTIMLICPSDHHIADVPAFHEAVQAAAALAQEGHMVAFGITPDRPETGYGYIRKGDTITGGFAVDRFVEKPDHETAVGFLESGDFSWNGGIFAFRADAFLAELEAHRAEMATGVAQAMEGMATAERVIHPAADPFLAIKGESVDYAVMENTAHAAMVPVSMGWSDIGNWQALHEARAKDSAGNATQGRVDMQDCRNVLIDSDGPRVSAVGLENITIVVDGDEVLVTTMDGAQAVGKLPGAANQ